MTWAWYGHLRKPGWSILAAIGVSWLIALPEYCFQVPANRIGHVSSGGPLSAAQLKIIQECITLVVFTLFAIFILKERIRPTDIAGFVLVFAGVAVSVLGGRGSGPAEPVSPTSAQEVGAPSHESGNP